MSGLVFVLGALHLDVVVTAPTLPRIDETVVGRDVAYVFGGKGGNQAVAAARFGAAVAMAGHVGDDAFGLRLLQGLDDAGVDRTQVQCRPGPSGMSVATVDADGNYAATIVSGVNREIDGTGVTLPPATRVLVLQNEIPPAANRAVSAVADPGICVIVNAAPAARSDPDLLGRADILVVNRVEAADLSGTGGDDPAAMALALLETGAGSVVVTLGAQGLVLARPGGAIRQLPGHPVKVQSTHGAGDCFVGALAAEIAAGRDLDQALEFAQRAAAALVATAVVDRPGLDRAQVESFFVESDV